MLRRIILLLAVALPGVACKKSSSGDYSSDAYDYGAAAPQAPADYGGYGGDEDEPLTISADMDDSPPEPSAREERVSKRKSGVFGRRDRAARSEMASAPPSPQASTPAGTAAPAADPAEPAVAQDEEIDAGRHIVYTASMHVSVFNLQEAMEAAEALPEKYGGYIANMNESSLVLRIPSRNLRPLMSEIGELGVIEHRTLQAQDVTDEFYDIESRITALEKTHAQLLDLLGKARTVQEALEVRRALDEIAMELEVLKGRMRKLENLISYSTLTLGLQERGPFTPTPSSNDPFPWVDSLGVEATEWK